MSADRKTSRRACLQVAGSAAAVVLMGRKAQALAAETDVLELFGKRQSVRRYKSDPVPEDHLRRILDAARRAPTSGNQQPWRFLVVRDRTKIDRMRSRCLEGIEGRLKDLAPAERDARMKAAKESMAGYFSAPVYVVVLTDSQSTYPSYNHHDGPLAAGYLCLAARALGYGTVYITDAIPDAVTREVLAIPERYQRVCITPIGVPAAWPEPKAKKRLEEMVAYESLA